jgi:hypothetical protein
MTLRVEVALQVPYPYGYVMTYLLISITQRPHAYVRNTDTSYE